MSLSYTIPIAVSSEAHVRSLGGAGTEWAQELQQVDILAQSFQRAANMSTLVAEARAHLRAGIIQENLRQLPKAVERYTQFLGWCDPHHDDTAQGGHQLHRTVSDANNNW
jgi:hypothetical protein